MIMPSYYFILIMLKYFLFRKTYVSISFGRYLMHRLPPRRPVYLKPKNKTVNKKIFTYTACLGKQLTVHQNTFIQKPTHRSSFFQKYSVFSKFITPLSDSKETKSRKSSSNTS